jgi:hypothetical protein
MDPAVLLLLAFGFSLWIRLVSVAMLNGETIVPPLEEKDAWGDGRCCDGFPSSL